MASHRLRIVKRTPTVLGVCEKCNAEFDSLLLGQEVDWEIQAQFDTHKCRPLDASQNALRVVREATGGK